MKVLVQVLTGADLRNNQYLYYMSFRRFRLLLTLLVPISCLAQVDTLHPSIGELELLVGRFAIKNQSLTPDGGWQTVGWSAATIAPSQAGRFLEEEAQYLMSDMEINMHTFIGYDDRLRGFKLAAMDKEFGLMDIYYGEQTKEGAYSFTNIESDIPFTIGEDQFMHFRLTYDQLSEQGFVHLVEGTMDGGESWQPFTRSIYRRLNEEESVPELLPTSISWSAATGDELESLYWPEAISVLPNGEAIQGASAISDLWSQTFEGVNRQNLQLVEQVFAGRAQEYQYELSTFATDNYEQFAQLVVWNLKEDKALRELEFVVKYNNPLVDLSGIDAARDLWMEHCNNHRVDLLIGEVYTPNTFYYNHKSPTRGRADLIERYDYMNNERYQLTLTPIHTEAVSQDIAIEIGQCSGSYGGRYVIVWQKQPDGRWMVLLDSNV